MILERETAPDEYFYYEQANTSGWWWPLLVFILIFAAALYFVIISWTFVVIPITLLLIAPILRLLFVFGYFESGVEIDLVEMKYRKYFGRLNRKQNWNQIIRPKNLYILKSTSLINKWRSEKGFARVTRDFPFSTREYFYYQLVLVANDSDLLLFTSQLREDVIYVAKQIRIRIPLSVIERTTGGDEIIIS